jgi:hypothetical protein
MPAEGPVNVLKSLQFVDSNLTPATIDLARTYTNDFVK